MQASDIGAFLNYPSQRVGIEGYYSDVYDGDVWKSFEADVDENDFFFGISMCWDGA